MSQGGMVSIFQDFPMSPDMVSEVKVLTIELRPGVRLVDCRADHGGDEVGRQHVPRRRRSNTTAMIRSTRGSGEPPRRSSPFNTNNYGANIGGPVKLPFLWSDQRQELLLLQLRRLPADRRPRTSRRCRFRHSPSETATSGTGATTPGT